MKELKPIRALSDVARLRVGEDRLFHSASHEEIMAGATTDVYFVKTYELLSALGLAGTEVTAEIFPRVGGVLAGVEEALNLLRRMKVEVWALDEGKEFGPMEVVMRIKGAYDEFGIYETALLGFLAAASGWATRARECRRAAGDKKFVCFAARHVHPAVAPVMERAAVVGGADGASCLLGACLAGREPMGTLPHSIFLIVGDSVEVARAYHRFMPPDAPRIILVDTFKDEAEETMRVAEALGEDLLGVRLDTPSERGGVTAELVAEVRARLDQGGFREVKILVSGGLTPEKMAALGKAGVDLFGVGSYISAAPPIDMTMDLKEVRGRPVAKRGRIPGIIPNPRLQKVI